MTLLTLAKYLVGSREAILSVARSPQAIWIGLLFVLAAGFAREYDGEDLLHEPWHLLIPLGASLASSLVLYLLVRLAAYRRQASEPTLVHGYIDFLTLYWMTAPLALLYAIPFERFLSAADATRANLWLLGLVALWRVLLITRVISVIYQASFVAAFFVVMLFADTLAVVILGMTPLPIVGIMGGIRLSESEQVLHNVGWAIRVLGTLTWPLWLIGACVVAARRQPAWSYVPADAGGSVRAARQLWIGAIAAVAAWGFVLPLTQPEQRLRRQDERDLRAGRIDEALATMSAHQRDDFPPHWDPPPRVAYREATPDIVELQARLNRANVAPWVHAVFAQKFENSLRGEDEYSGVWSFLSAEEIERRIETIAAMPNRAEVIREHQEGLMGIVTVDEYGSAASTHGPIYPEPLRARIRALLDEAGVPDQTVQQNGESGTGSP
jgi:hypothetical protein